MPRMFTTLDAPRGADHGHPFRIGIFCRCCRSDNVGRDGAARWNAATQTWELSSVHDGGFCDGCGADHLVERRLDLDGDDAGPVAACDRYDNEDG